MKIIINKDKHLSLIFDRRILKMNLRIREFIILKDTFPVMLGILLKTTLFCPPMKLMMTQTTS